VISNAPRCLSAARGGKPAIATGSRKKISILAPICFDHEKCACWKETCAEKVIARMVVSNRVSSNFIALI